MRVFALPGMVMIACPPALTSGGAVGLFLAAPPTVQIPTDQGDRGGSIRRELLNGLFVLVVASLLPEDEAATAGVATRLPTAR